MDLHGPLVDPRLFFRGRSSARRRGICSLVRRCGREKRHALASSCAHISNGYATQEICSLVADREVTSDAADGQPPSQRLASVHLAESGVGGTTIMALELRPSCEYCGRDLPPASRLAGSNGTIARASSMPKAHSVRNASPAARAGVAIPAATREPRTGFRRPATPIG